MSKIVITGANGFLGSWLVRALNNHGISPTILVRPSSDLSELKGLLYTKVLGDITAPGSLESCFTGADAVFHLAGFIAYKKSDRAKMDLINVQGTQNVVSACEKAHVKKLIHVSSVVAVGAGFTAKEVLSEDSKFNLKHLNLGYFETKRQAEEIVKKATSEGKIQSVIVNPSTIYGAGDAKKGSRKIQIKVAQGSFPFYTDGGVSIVAVEDVVEAMIAAWKRGRNGERYILSGENVSIRELFNLIADANGVNPPSIKLPRWLLKLAAGETAWTSTLFHWFDHSKATQDLGFHPRPASEAIQNSVKWMQENGLLK